MDSIKFHAPFLTSLHELLPVEGTAERGDTAPVISLESHSNIPWDAPETVRIGEELVIWRLLIVHLQEYAGERVDVTYKPRLEDFPPLNFPDQISLPNLPDFMSWDGRKAEI